MAIIDKAAEQNGLHLADYERQSPRFNSATGQWSVFFQGKRLEPGGFFTMLVDDQTGAVEILNGM